MGLFDFTEEDLARSKKVAPGWYPVIITKIEDKPASTDQSNNTWVTVKGTAGDANLVEIGTCFNEKANGFSGVMGFIKALQNGEAVVKGQKYEINKSLEGRQLEAFIAPGDNGKGVIVNQCKEWRPLSVAS